MNRRQRRIPVTSLRDDFGMSMHINLRLLAYAPTSDAFDGLATVFNVVQLAIKDDPRRSEQAAIITAGATALIAMESRVCRGVIPNDSEIAQVRAGVNAVDQIMGRMDVGALYCAMAELRSMTTPPTEVPA